jgi:hypothetical protein
VMAGHNKKGWERVRDGSVADEVASRVRCPVIVLRMASSGWQAYDCLTETYISLN